MPQSPLIATSILDADYLRLADQIDAVTGPPGVGTDWLHLDVMDAHFVPNLTFGLPLVKALHAYTDIPLDCHLMIDNPDRWAIQYAEAGAYNVTVHAEAVRNPVAIAKNLHDVGAKAGLSLKPDTRLHPYRDALEYFDTLLIMSVEPGFGKQPFMPEVLDKVRTARHLVDAGQLRVVVQIDGGINERTIKHAAAAGVDCFVIGSAIYGSDNPSQALADMRSLLPEYGKK